MTLGLGLVVKGFAEKTQEALWTRVKKETEMILSRYHPFALFYRVRITEVLLPCYHTTPQAKAQAAGACSPGYLGAGVHFREAPSKYAALKSSLPQRYILPTCFLGIDAVWDTQTVLQIPSYFFERDIIKWVLENSPGEHLRWSLLLHLIGPFVRTSSVTSTSLFLVTQKVQRQNHLRSVFVVLYKSQKLFLQHRNCLLLKNLVQ